MLDSIESIAIMEFVLDEWETLKKYVDVDTRGTQIATMVRRHVRASGINIPDCWATRRHNSASRKYLVSGKHICDFIDNIRSNTKMRQKIRKAVDNKRRGYYKALFPSYRPSHDDVPLIKHWTQASTALRPTTPRFTRKKRSSLTPSPQDKGMHIYTQHPPPSYRRHSPHLTHNTHIN